MRLIGKLRGLGRLDGAERRLVIEAAAMLALARLVVRLLPFRVIAAGLRRWPESGAADPALARRVRAAVTIAARNVPWNAVCLPQAIAAKAMLALRGSGSALHLGAAFDGDGRIVAHAWLTAGGEVVIGAGGVAGVSALARFG
jgi:hypothetical protein